MVQIKRVETKSDWKAFLDLPWKIYPGDPSWVPQLKIATKDLLDVQKNPFFKHAMLYPLMAFRDGQPVGRLVGIIDDHYNQFQKESRVAFGFFECLNDAEATQAMLDEVARWGKQWGMTTLRGPINLSGNYEVGLLVDGFKKPPFVNSNYNPPYYEALLKGYGLNPCKDLYAYEISKTSKFSDRIFAHAERLKKNASIEIRTLDLKNFDQEARLVFDIYNDAWEKLWGFVPLDWEEFQHIAKDLKLIVDPEMVFFAMQGGEAIGFGLALPDANQVLKNIRSGQLLPLNWIKLFWHLKGPFRKKSVNRLRVYAVGVKKAYQHLGLGAVLYAEYFKRGPSSGYAMGEAGQILEDNKTMNRALELMQAERSRVYRIYDRPLLHS